MAESDRQFLFLNTNRMSNDRFPVTVIEDEKTAYYDVGLRLKASAYGRYNSSHYGFNIRFQPDQLVPRRAPDASPSSAAGTLKEILAKHLMNRAGGGYWSFYDDVAHIITPTTGDRGIGLLSMARHTSDLLRRALPGCAPNPARCSTRNCSTTPTAPPAARRSSRSATPTTTPTGATISRDRGTDKEPYRWGFQIRSARGRDDYSQIDRPQPGASAPERDRLEERPRSAHRRRPVDAHLRHDVAQWHRRRLQPHLGTQLPLTTSGPTDAEDHRLPVGPRPRLPARHRCLGHARPATSRASEIAKLFAIPQYRRLFDGHLDDLIQTTFNSTYVAPWATHFTSLTGDNVNQTSYITNRANSVLGTLPAAVTFAITTNGGSRFLRWRTASSTSPATAGSMSSRSRSTACRRPITWTDADSWQITVPIAIGANLLDPHRHQQPGRRGRQRHASPSPTPAPSNSPTPATRSSANSTTIPPTRAPAEIDRRLHRCRSVRVRRTHQHRRQQPIDFTGVGFTDGIEFTFPAGTTLAPGRAP